MTKKTMKAGNYVIPSPDKAKEHVDQVLERVIKDIEDKLVKDVQTCKFNCAEVACDECVMSKRAPNREERVDALLKALYSTKED